MARTKHGLKAAVAVITALIVSLMMFMIPNNSYALDINKTSATLTKGYAMQLKITGGAAGANVSWSSSNKSVAAVSSKGKVVGRSVGTAVITAKTAGTTFKCTVNVVGGKLKAEPANVQLAAGEQRLVTITAKGSHSLKVKSSDKSIVTAQWASTSFNNDKVSLRLTGYRQGTASVRVYMTKYSNVFANINVTVGGGNPQNNANTGTLRVSTTSLNVNVNGNGSLTIYTPDMNMPNLSLSDNTVAVCNAGPVNNNNGQYLSQVTVTGLRAGTTVLTVSDRNNPNNFTRVTITVGSSATGKGTYYAVYDDQNTSRYIANTDRYMSFYDNSKGKTRYVLVPGTNAYDIAQYNSAVAAATNNYQTYVIYATSPNGYNVNYNSYGTTSFGNTVVQFNATITDVLMNNGNASMTNANVTRYILVPTNYDPAQVNYLEAQYRKQYEYGVVYNQNPLNGGFSRRSYDDKVYTFNSTRSGATGTRYLVYPSYVADPENQYSSVLQAYGVAAGTSQMGTYYSVYTSYNSAWSAKRSNSDVVLDISAGGKNYYVLCPYNYEVADANTAVAKYTKIYQYNMIYSATPTKLNVYTDWIDSWKKVVNGKTVTHYALFPDNSATYQQMSYSLQISDGVTPTPTYEYYEVIYTRPVTTGGDILISWVNVNLGTPCYMVVPSNYDILRVNDIKVANGAQYELYHIYTTEPKVASMSGIVIREGYYTGNGAFKHCYCYLPTNYSEELLSRAFAGYEV